MTHEELLHADGFAFIPGAWYENAYRDSVSASGDVHPHAQNLLQQYGDLTLDPYSPGNRLRAYIQCRLDVAGDLMFGQFEPYFQTRAYNPDTGGIVRTYPPVPKTVLENSLFRFLISDDIRFVERYGHLGHPASMIIGVHLFRYRATAAAPAFSSPAWLHRDDEDIVFIHLLGLSRNARGADNIIALDTKHIERVMRLERLLDTFVVNHQKLHGVTPLWCDAMEGRTVSCTRDIVLVTFQKRSSNAA